MGQDQGVPSGPELSQGIESAQLPEGGKVLGHIDNEAVLVVRNGGKLFAIGATCTHYSGPLADGLVVDGTVRCPWHHACFDLATGEAVRAPALASVACWQVVERDGRVVVQGKKPTAAHPRHATGEQAVRTIVIVGGGAAGFAAAEMLRRDGYSGKLVMLSNDDAAPVDRPNLSKDYLAGKAPEDWVPLRPDSFYADSSIDLRLGAEVGAIDPRAREVVLADGSKVGYERLLLATGAEPVKLSVPGADLPHVHTLRSLRDCRAIIGATQGARRAVVVGASFIGLEVAAALRERGLDVHVVAPETRPMERVLGPQLGDFIRSLHEEHGVVFHLQDVPASIEAKRVLLKSGGALDADLVVAGIGVRPRLALAEQAGLMLDRGLVVDEYLETGAPGVFAAGDIVRWPDPHSGERIRVEHWVVAERQGQAAARNMLGAREPFTDVPFFWSQHYDVPINYVGHAEKWDTIEIDGDVAARDCMVRYMSKGRALATASIYRDEASLQAEAAMERRLAAAG
jgi:NADPH-dependent 2,4-dienoyl-CoA reductase/sulfur reductase-like enzyme/nitrite reductase/ring-hydroxylating ferredoxin subunit